MRRLLLFVCLLIITSPFAAASTWDGAWVLSGKWTGYMGVALKIRGDQYKYWFSSDAASPTFTATTIINGKTTTTSSRVEKPPRYPLHGRLRAHGDIIELLGPGDYYDRKWRRIVYRGVPCLLAEQHYREWRRTGRLADDRLLFRAPTFDEKRPKLNYGGMQRTVGRSAARLKEGWSG